MTASTTRSTTALLCPSFVRQKRWENRWVSSTECHSFGLNSCECDRGTTNELLNGRSTIQSLQKCQCRCDDYHSCLWLGFFFQMKSASCRCHCESMAHRCWDLIDPARLLLPGSPQTLNFGRGFFDDFSSFNARHCHRFPLFTALSMRWLSNSNTIYMYYILLIFRVGIIEDNVRCILYSIDIHLKLYNK